MLVSVVGGGHLAIDKDRQAGQEGPTPSVYAIACVPRAVVLWL